MANITREQRLKNKLTRMEMTLKNAIADGHENLINNYLTYLDVLHSAATGTLKDQNDNVVSVTAATRVSAAKVMADKVERLSEELALDKVISDNSESEWSEYESGPDTKPVENISLMANYATKVFIPIDVED